MADTESTAAFAELKDEGQGKGSGSKQSSDGKGAVTIPINPMSSSKPLPTTVPKPSGVTSEGFAALFPSTTAARFTGDWFMFYLQQRRVLIILLLALFLLILLIWILALGKAPATSTGSTGSCQLFADSEIMGDVISVCPPAVATVFYPSSASVNMGYSTVNSADTALAPTGIFVPRAQQSAFYTAIFVDPDSPSARTPDNRSYLRGICANLRLYTNVTLSTGDWLVPYEAPAPPLGTGSHRYVWLVYRHSSAVSGITPPSRNKFDVEAWFRSSWTQQPQLVAANFFRSAS